MTRTVAVVVPAHNESGRIGAMVSSLGPACVAAVGEDASALVHVVVVAHACSDDTAAVAAAAIAAWADVVVQAVASARVVVDNGAGAKVRAIRAGLVALAGVDIDVVVVADADIVVGVVGLAAVVAAVVADVVVVASAPQTPLPPRRRTPLAWALHRYNATRGFRAQRQWFNGRFYATRRWDFPDDDDVRARAAADGDGDDGSPLGADDVWLSRAALSVGPGAIVSVNGAADDDHDDLVIEYRAPETLAGMCQHLRRLRREVGRVNRLFPKLPRPSAEGSPQPQDLADGIALAIFNVALMLCRLWLWLETRRASAPIEPWPVVRESKAP